MSASKVPVSTAVAPVGQLIATTTLRSTPPSRWASARISPGSPSVAKASVIG